MYLDRANWGVAEANYQQAFLEYKSIKQGGDLDAAMKSLDVALTAMPTHKQAATLKKKVRGR